MPLYEFECMWGHRTEAIRPVGHAMLMCGTCGHAASRRTANRVAIAQPAVDTRGMYRRFNEASLEMEHADAKVEASTGQKVQSPSLWKVAKRRAIEMHAVGEAPPTIRS